MKQFKIGCKFAEERLTTEARNMVMMTGFFRKIHLFKAAILLYQSSLERKTFVKLKKTKLLHLVIKLTKLFSVPKACTR